LGGKVTCASRSSTRSRFHALSDASSKISFTSDSPNSEKERKCTTSGMPFIAISSGMVTCCSICSAEIPGHCVITST
jgi:hypothetical protein